MSAIEVAVKASQRLERILEERFGAVGRGLHEKLTSVENHVPLHVAQTIRYIATVRNKVVHEGAEIPDLDDFSQSVQEVAASLERLPPGGAGGALFTASAVRSRGSFSRLGWVAALFCAALVAAALIFARVLDTHSRLPAELDVPRGAPTADTSSELAQELGTKASATREVSGSLAALAQKASTNAADARKDIDDNFWNYLHQNTRITLGQPNLKDNGDGTQDLRVQVGFSIDPAPLAQVLGRYFAIYTGAIDFSDHMGDAVPGIAIRKYDNEGAHQKLPFSADLLRYLTRRQARIRVSAGTHSAQLTIATGRQCFVSCQGAGSDMFQVHVNNRELPHLTILTYQGDEQNPLVIRHIPVGELGKIGALSAVIEIGDRPLSEQERQDKFWRDSNAMFGDQIGANSGKAARARTKSGPRGSQRAAAAATQPAETETPAPSGDSPALNLQEIRQLKSRF